MLLRRIILCFHVVRLELLSVKHTLVEGMAFLFEQVVDQVWSILFELVDMVIGLTLNAEAEVWVLVLGLNLSLCQEKLLFCDLGQSMNETYPMIAMQAIKQLDVFISKQNVFIA